MNLQTLDVQEIEVRHGHLGGPSPWCGDAEPILPEKVVEAKKYGSMGGGYHIYVWVAWGSRIRRPFSGPSSPTASGGMPPCVAMPRPSEAKSEKTSSIECRILSIWYVVYGIWYMVYGMYMVYGRWYMVYGTWYMVCIWYMVHGIWEFPTIRCLNMV